MPSTKTAPSSRGGVVFSACIVSLFSSVAEYCNAKYQNGSLVTREWLA